MDGFDATEIDKLFDYKLGDLGEDGRVPQPTTAEARKFREEILAAQCLATGLTPEEAEQQPEKDGELSLFDKRMAALTFEQKDQLGDNILEAVIEVCKGHPSRDELTTMPGLTRLAFCNWLMGVLSPLF